jgi:hypothetical protein
LCEAPFGPFRQKVAVTFLNHAKFRTPRKGHFANGIQTSMSD